ncbi:hypothetical protein GCM10009677_29450 [Sphaerisporangium rubeum]|uniref:DDE Tnp4 domain-containing protein n=1 Tax=Sphaerisporangium rubeum TaxID=321317 RepID=A0A7X0IEK4_9ACTN|nr:hypothetical protein [Sphaerisporangium rubeum]MBB6473716.1 hypothetical protein [Sphaerisporangium rubeum]
MADKDYIGAGEHIHVPYRGKDKPAGRKQANSSRVKLRAPGERANALLKTWRILANSAAALTAQVSSSKPSPCYSSKKQDEKRSRKIPGDLAKQNK